MKGYDEGTITNQEQQDIEEFLLKIKKFILPSIQRGLVWENNDAKDLFIGILMKFFNYEDNNNNTKFDFGEINTTYNKFIKVFYLYDGQQRVTCIFLLIGVLYNILSKFNPTLEEYDDDTNILINNINDLCKLLRELVFDKNKKKEKCKIDYLEEEDQKTFNIVFNSLFNKLGKDTLDEKKYCKANNVNKLTETFKECIQESFKKNNGEFDYKRIYNFALFFIKHSYIINLINKEDEAAMEKFLRKNSQGKKLNLWNLIAAYRITNLAKIFTEQNLGNKKYEELSDVDYKDLKEKSENILIKNRQELLKLRLKFGKGKKSPNKAAEFIYHYTKGFVDYLVDKQRGKSILQSRKTIKNDKSCCKIGQITRHLTKNNCFNTIQANCPSIITDETEFKNLNSYADFACDIEKRIYRVPETSEVESLLSDIRGGNLSVSYKITLLVGKNLSPHLFRELAKAIKCFALYGMIGKVALESNKKIQGFDPIFHILSEIQSLQKEEQEKEFNYFMEDFIKEYIEEYRKHAHECCKLKIETMTGNRDFLKNNILLLLGLGEKEFGEYQKELSLLTEHVDIKAGYKDLINKYFKKA